MRFSHFVLAAAISGVMIFANGCTTPISMAEPQIAKPIPLGAFKYSSIMEATFAPISLLEHGSESAVNKSSQYVFLGSKLTVGLPLGTEISGYVYHYENPIFQGSIKKSLFDYEGFCFSAEYGEATKFDGEPYTCIDSDSWFSCDGGYHRVMFYYHWWGLLGSYELPVQLSPDWDTKFGVNFRYARYKLHANRYVSDDGEDPWQYVYRMDDYVRNMNISLELKNRKELDNVTLEGGGSMCYSFVQFRYPEYASYATKFCIGLQWFLSVDFIQNDSYMYTGDMGKMYPPR